MAKLLRFIRQGRQIPPPTSKIVSASVTSGGSSSSGAIVITRTGTASTISGYQVTLTASIPSLSAGNHSIITATVRDGYGNIASGLPVTFAFVNNNSSAPALSVVSGTTDASGSVSTPLYCRVGFIRQRPGYHRGHSHQRRL